MHLHNHRERERLARLFPFLLLFLLLTTACERNINLSIPNAQRRLVVNGHIEIGSPAYVSITFDQAFFDPIDLRDTAFLRKYFVTDATVTLSNGTTTEVLHPGLRLDDFTAYTYLGADIIGEAGKHYTLHIQYHGYDLQATTKVPVEAPPDSLWVVPKPNPQSARDSQLVNLYFRYPDPDTPGNFTRAFTKRQGDAYYTTDLGGVYTDRIVNGQNVTFVLRRGMDPTLQTKSDSVDLKESGFFARGDTIQVKWASIDRATYDFYFTQTNAALATGNPFASPVSIQSNIKALPGSKGKAIGIWGGYGATYLKPFIVP